MCRSMITRDLNLSLLYILFYSNFVSYCQTVCMWATADPNMNHTLTICDVWEMTQNFSLERLCLYRHPFNGVFSSSHKQVHRCSFLNVITDGEWLTDLHCGWGYLRLTLRLASLAWCEIDCKAYFGIIQFHKISKRLLEL